MTTIQDSGQGVPAAMRAIRLHSPDGPAGLRFEQVETPWPKHVRPLSGGETIAPVGNL